MTVASIARVEGRLSPAPVGEYVTDGAGLAFVIDYLPKSDEVVMEDAVTGETFYVVREAYVSAGWKHVKRKERRDG